MVNLESYPSHIRKKRLGFNDSIVEKDSKEIVFNKIKAINSKNSMIQSLCIKK